MVSISDVLAGLFPPDPDIIIVLNGRYHLAGALRSY